MRKGMEMGMGVLVFAIIAVLLIFLLATTISQSFVQLGEATSACEQDRSANNICVPQGTCPQGNAVSLSCSQQGETCCSTLRLPLNTRTVSR